MSQGGGGSSNTTTQVQQIPAFEQQSSEQNQQLAQSLASQSYPQYQGQLIQGQNQNQAIGQSTALAANTNWQPEFQQAQESTSNAMNPSQFNSYLGAAGNQVNSSLNPSGFNAYENAAKNQVGTGLDSSTVTGAQHAQAGAAQQAQALTNPNAVGAYMNPYVQQALAPQISDLNLQLNQQQQGINSQAAQAGAFGDARQGAAQGLQNYYGNQALNQLIGTGYNNAYTQALNAVGQAQGTQLGAASQYGNIAQSGLGEQGIQQKGADQYANLAGQQQTEQQIGLQGAQLEGNFAGLANQEQNTQLQGANQQQSLANQLQQQTLSGANAAYNVGQQQQTQGQNELNASYQQYLNQVNWPYQMLNVRESALSNSPYNISTAVTLPSANSTAQGFGTLASASGLLSGLSSGSSNNSPYGGSQISGTH